MRIVISRGQAIAFLAAAAVMVFSTAALSQTLVNGNFEGGNTGGVATGWTSYAGGTINPTIQTANPPEGLQYQQIQVTVANNYGGVYQRVTGCTPCTTYTISGYMRTNSASATATVLADPAGGTSRAAASAVSAGTSSTAWVTFSGNVTATSNAVTIFLDAAVTTSNKACAFDNITIVPAAGPAVPTGASANPSSICGGGSSTLTASVAAGCTVDWYAGSCCGTLVGSGTSLVVSPGSTTTYYPRARNLTTGIGSAGCGTPVTVTASPGPAAPTSVSANPSSINSGQSSTLSASVEAGCTVDWYSGSCGGTLVGSGTTLVVTPGSTTTYYPRARNTTTGCTSSSCGSSVTVTVTIPYSPIKYVRHHAGPIYDGLSWATAFYNVQDAVNACISGDEVWVAAGTYTENVVVPSGVSLYGGFAGTETARSQRNWFNNISVIDGNFAGPAVEIARSAASNTRVDGFTITNGRAVCGGGVYCNQLSLPVIANNLIKNNLADFDGGGVYCNLGSVAVIACNRIINNAAFNAGGGVRSTTGNVTVANNSIAGNTAEYGGGICAGDSHTTNTATHEYLINNTIAANAAVSGGGMYFYPYSSASVSNNIVASNSSGIRKGSGSGVLTLKKNCVYANSAYNYSGVSAGSTDIQVDPQLASVAYGNFHIQPGSPCRNAGDNTQVVSGYNDVDNQTRIQNTTVDIGADESDGTTWTVNPAIVRVSTTGNDANNGSSWALAKRTIQAAVDAASATGGEVWVKAGTYNEQVTLRDGVYVYGGFAGTETSRSQRNYVTNLSIIDGQTAGSCVTARNLGYRVCALDGFKLQNGKDHNGAGVFCDLASPLILNNTITGGTALGCGGGVYLGNCLALVEANSITNNKALRYGGGIYSLNGAPTISRNNIENNVGVINGSGIHASTNSACSIVNNRIVKNKQDASFPGTWGLAVGVDSYGAAVMTCNTVSDNSPGSNGAIYAGVYGNMSMYSNIVWGNSSGIVKGTNATVAQTATYTSDPLFVNRSGGDYSLRSGSGCIDAADPATAPSVDFTGAARPVDGNGDGTPVADIGCYEYGAGSSQPPVPPTSATATPSTICAGSSSTLHADGGSGTTLRWLTGSCSGTSVGTGNDLVVYPTTTTTYYARWENALGNSACVSTTVTVSGVAPTATVGGPQTIQAGGTTTALGGNTPTPPATGVWSIVSGGTGTFSSTTDPNATFTHTGGDGPVVLRWTVSLPPCTPASADVTITILGDDCIFNGDFEEGFTNGVGNGWTKVTPESGTWAQETTIKHGGTSSQKITDASGAPAYTSWIYQSVTVKPGRVYVPTMWIYRVDLAVPRIGVDPNGGTSFVGGDAAPPQNQWVYRVEDPFIAGSGGVATIAIAAGYQTNSGTVYFDDISVQPQAPQSVGGTATITAGNSATLTASGGFGGSSDELCWYTGPNGTGTKVGTGTTLVVWPTSTTTYYPRWETSGPCGVSADGASVTVTVLPPAGPPTVTSITPASGANTGTVSITDLAGTNFVSGAGVKLRRAGYTDINASSVVVSSPTKITCLFDLTGRKTGLWDVVVTNPDLQSASLANGFGITIAESSGVVGTSIGSLMHSIAGAASAAYRFRVWGSVETIDSSTFWLDDGSGTRIKVFAPGYAGLSTGDFASAVGTIDASVSPIVLVTRANQITKLN